MSTLSRRKSLATSSIERDGLHVPFLPKTGRHGFAHRAIKAAGVTDLMGFAQGVAKVQTIRSVGDAGFQSERYRGGRCSITE